MKILLFRLSLFTALCTSACGQQQNVEKRVSDLEKRVTALEKASPLSLFTAASPSPAVETKAPLEVVSWDAHLGRGEYSQYHYTITLTLKNNSDKDIKLIDASVQFSDLLGSQIYAIKVAPDHLIPAGKAVTEKGDYSVPPRPSNGAAFCALLFGGGLFSLIKHQHSMGSCHRMHG